MQLCFRGLLRPPRAPCERSTQCDHPQTAQAYGRTGGRYSRRTRPFDLVGLRYLRCVRLFCGCRRAAHATGQASVFPFESSKTAIRCRDLMQSAAASLRVEPLHGAIRVQVAHGESPGALERFQAATRLKPEPRIVRKIVVRPHVLASSVMGFSLSPGPIIIPASTVLRKPSQSWMSENSPGATRVNRIIRLLQVVALTLPWFVGAAPAQASEPTDALYRIGVDDQLQVAVWRNPELSVSVPVRPDGRISVPLVGDVLAGGRTPEEVAEDIEKQLAAYVRDPKVAVILTELRSHEFISRVRVTGAVRTPISIPHRQGMTVLDAVLQAGGVNEFAAANRTRLYRREGEGTEAIDVRLGAILGSGDLETNLEVRPGDVITVPERAL